MNGKEILRWLQADGWTILPQEGSHSRLGKGTLRTTVPLHGTHDLKPGTLASIERQTGVKFRK